jgi:hypothetical protein
MGDAKLERLRRRLRESAGVESSHVLDNLASLVPTFDPGEERLGRMFITTVEALFSDSDDAEALKIGVRLANCCPRSPCGLVFCPRCRKAKQAKIAADVIDRFGLVPRDRLRFLTVIDSVQTSHQDLPAAFRRFRKKLANAFSKSAPDARVFGYLEVDIKTPDMFNGTYQNSHGVAVDHRPHAKALLKGLGLDLDSPPHPAKFYLLHLHAIVDLGCDTNDLNSDAILKRSFPHPYQVRVTPLWPEQPRCEGDKRFATVEESLTRISGYMLKFKLQYADNIFADSPGKTTLSKYKGAYPASDIVDLCKLADDGQNFKMFGYKYNCEQVKTS